MLNLLLPTETNDTNVRRGSSVKQKEVIYTTRFPPTEQLSSAFFPLIVQNSVAKNELFIAPQKVKCY